MRRVHLVAAGTVAGIGGVLAFPTQHVQLALPSASSASAKAPASPSTSSSSSTSEAAASPTAAAPSVATPAPTVAASRSATGTDEVFRYGDMAVSVTVQGNKITKVNIAAINENDGRSASIDSYAIPELEQQVIAANSANIQGVSGATYTSEAFAASVSSALSKLGFQG